MKRKLLWGMLAITGAGIWIAHIYYQGQNRSVDPRIVPARELYSRYDELASSGDFKSVFRLLDSIEQIYRSYPHYDSSFELGVLDNNRGAALLTLALHRDSIPGSSDPFPRLSGDSLVSLARHHLEKAISTYTRWQSAREGLSQSELENRVSEDFWEGWDPRLEQESRMVKKRAGEIGAALTECPRRLSVCYSNLGLTHRLTGEHEQAVSHYLHALELWDRNLEAENNLNRILNQPLKKRNIIQKLFPPSRNNGS